MFYKHTEVEMIVGLITTQGLLNKYGFTIINLNL